MIVELLALNVHGIPFAHPVSLQLHLPIHRITMNSPHFSSDFSSRSLLCAEGWGPPTSELAEGYRWMSG